METETSDVDLERMELNVTTPTPSMDRSPVYFLLVLCPIVFLFGIFGNTLVITIVIKHAKIRNKSISNYYILNLAAADELLLLTLPFYLISTYTSDWMFGEAVCKLSYLFRESNKYTGILTLVALSVDRCLASYHNTAALRRVPVGVSVCIGVWLVALCASLFHAINATVTVKHSRRRCRLVWSLTVEDRAALIYSQLVFGLAVPLAVIAGANAILLWRLRRRAARRRASSTAPRRQISTSKGLTSLGHMTMTKLVIVVVSVFVGCQVPYHVLEIMSLTTFQMHSADKSYFPSGTYRTAFIYINTAAQLLVYVSSCCNPVIYGIFNQNYRHLYAKALCCKWSTDQASLVTRQTEFMNGNEDSKRARERTQIRSASIIGTLQVREAHV